MRWRDVEAAAPGRGVNLRLAQAIEVGPPNGEAGDELSHPIIRGEDGRPLGARAETLVCLAGLVRIETPGARQNAQIKSHWPDYGSAPRPIGAILEAP